MNEIAEYTPDSYHINHTHSIFVELENTTVRLRRPKTNVPKRALWDETSIPAQSFIHQRFYDIEGSRVFLMPAGLVKKRIWSKKYPICIALAKHGEKSETLSKSPTKDPPHSPLRETKSGTPDSDSGFEIISESKCIDNILYLFARTCREKEDWYKQFAAAAKGFPLPSHLGQVRQCLRTTNSHYRASPGHARTPSTSEDKPQHKRQGSTDSISSVSSSPQRETEEYKISQPTMEQYIRYMGRLMPKQVFEAYLDFVPGDRQSGSYPEPVDCEPGILWMNSFISRIFWDFLKQKYFVDLMLDKIQRKLSKIHVSIVCTTYPLSVNMSFLL